MNSEKETTYPDPGSKQSETTDRSDIELRRIKTMYKVSFISASVSVIFLLLLLGALWFYIKDQRLEKINRIYDAVTRREGEVLSSKPGDNEGAGTALSSELMEVEKQISEWREDTRRSLSTLSADINDHITDRLKSLAGDIKETKGSSTGAGTGSAAFEKAKSLWMEGDIFTAELYFRHAVEKEPENWNFVDTYSRAILAWCKGIKEDEAKKTVLPVLRNLEAFLRNQASFLQLGDLMKLKNLLGTVVQTRDRLEIDLEKQETDRALVKARGLLSRTQPADISGLERLHGELGLVKAFLRERDLDKSGGDGQNILTSLDQKIAEVEAGRQALDLVRQAEDLLNSAEKAALPVSVRTSYMTTALTVINQLMAHESQLDQGAGETVQKLMSRLQAVSGSIARKRAEAVLKELTNETDKNNAYFTVHPDRMCAEAIERLTYLARLCENRLTEINDPEASDRILEMLSRIHTAIARWKDRQLHRYEKWAVVKIRDFYETGLKEENGMKREDDLYSRFVSTFGDIDTRYLSFASARTYTEIFDLFYKELSDKQKIELTADIALMDKRELHSF